MGAGYSAKGHLGTPGSACAFQLLVLKTTWVSPSRSTASHSAWRCFGLEHHRTVADHVIPLVFSRFRCHRKLDCRFRASGRSLDASETLHAWKPSSADKFQDSGRRRLEVMELLRHYCYKRPSSRGSSPDASGTSQAWGRGRSRSPSACWIAPGSRSLSAETG